MKKHARVWVIVALVLCIISSLGAAVIQSDFGSISYRDITITADSGHQLNALLLVPDEASFENPAPAIVVSHGWYNNREMQDLNYVEYARRGYVVLAINMYGHGDSEDLPENTWWDDENNANGLYDGVKYLAEMPCVDSTRIGVTGHSNGARASREAVLQDEEGLISAALLVSNDAVYYTEFDEMAQMSGEGTGEFYNMFGNRDAAIVACQYDEFFHRVAQEDGSVSPPREYIDQVTAQSFLYFGEDPTGLVPRESYTFYSEEIDGEEAIRAIFNPAITHPWAHFSQSVVASSVKFFDLALDAPKDLDPYDQIWQIKAGFNGLGILGFFLFVVSAAVALLDVPIFVSLRAEEDVVPLPKLEGAAKKRARRNRVLGVLWGIVSYFIAFILGYAILRPDFWNQEASRVIGYWCVLTGLPLLFQMRKSVKKFGADTENTGLKMSFGNWIKTLILALIVVGAAFGIVFASDALFLTDYRLWCFATIRAFSLDKLGIILRFLPLWLLYYIPMSVAANCFNYVGKGKRNRCYVIREMFWVFIGPAIMIAAQYLVFFYTGFMITEAITGICIIWLFPIIVILPLSVLICRTIYKSSRNPYIGGLIMGIIACVLAVTNTLTYLA